MTVILIIAGVAVLLLAGLYAAYHKVFYSPKKDMSETVVPEELMRHPYRDAIKKDIKEICDTPCVFVKTRSADGLRLSARYYEGDEDKPLCICFHGYRGSALRDFSGLGLYLMKKGYNVLIVDERAHWRSQGHTIAFGAKERFDVLSWLRWSQRHFGDDIPVYLFGISMGAATVLMASGQKLPKNVKGISADCPYNSPKEIIKHVCRRMKLNPTLMWPIIWLSGLVWGRFNVNAASAAREVKKAKVPIMIIHGEGDNFVPMAMSKEVAHANASRVTMYTFPEAGHGLSYYYDTERYRQLVDDFMKKTN